MDASVPPCSTPLSTTIEIPVTVIQDIPANSGQVEVEVWDDWDGDGRRDNNEPGLDGVAIQLVDSQSGDVVYTDLSSGGISNLFAIPGTYRIQAILPDGNHVFTRRNQGNNEAIDSDVNPNDGRSSTFTLAGNDLLTTIDVGLWTPATIETEVWDDLNGDGRRQGDEPLVTVPVTVKLLDNSNNVLQTSETVDGIATFTNVPADSNVKLEYVLPAGYAFTDRNRGSNENIDSDANTSNGRTGTFRSESGAELITDVDAGVWSPASIVTEVWDDLDGNGRQNGDELLVTIPVTVNLLDGSNNLLQTTTTVDGVATFNNVPADSNVKLEYVLPAGYAFTDRNQGSNENVDSDANTSDGRTSTFRSESGGAVITDVDAGVWSPASIVTEVWDDLNGNGRQNGNEPLVTIPVTVNLLDGSNNLLQTTTTVNGVATFNDVPADTNVKLEYVLPAGYAFTLQNQGNEATDSDANRNNGQTATFRSETGSATITDIDAGIWSPGEVEAYVWHDVNGNGRQNNNEPGVAGVTVNLLYSDDTPVIDPLTNLPVTAVSDSAGVARLTYVPADTNVKLQFLRPTGYEFTDRNEGNDARDSDVSTNSGMTNTFRTTEGQQLIDTWDAGLILE